MKRTLKFLLSLATLGILFPPPDASAKSTQRAVSGIVEVEYRDTFKNDNRQHTFYFVKDKTTGKRTEIKLKAGRKQLKLQDGQQVTAAGTDSGDGILQQVVFSAEPTSALAATINPNNLGEVRTIVILYNWDTDPSWKPWTVEQIREEFFGSVGKTVSNYFREVSYGQSWLSGDVYGWYTIPRTDGMATLDQMLANAGVDLSSYKRIVYMHPPDGGVIAGSAGGKIVNINGNNDFGVIVHEVGHTFGLGHSHGLYCGAIASGLCRFLEYGDHTDVMGAGGNGKAPHFTASQKEELGYLPSPQLIQQSGVYRIEPMAIAPAGGTKSLKVAKGIDPTTGNTIWYYLEYRPPIGFDSSLQGMTPGVIFHLQNFQQYGYGWNEPYLLSFKDKNLGFNPTYGGSHMTDPALAIGKTYYDSEAKILFQTLSADMTGASMKITFGVQQPLLQVNNPAVSPQVVTVGSTMILTASASSSDSVIAAVDFSINGTPVCHVTSAPYTCNWVVPNIANTNYTLSVVATDVRGISSETVSRVLSTDATAPQISMTYPGYTNPTTVVPGGNSTVYYTGTDNLGIIKAELLINNVSVQQYTYPSARTLLYSYTSWSVPAYYANATYVVTIKLTDAGGNSVSGSITVTAGSGGAAPMIAPSVTFAAPTEGASLVPYLYTSVQVSGQSSTGSTIKSTTCYSDGLFVDECRSGLFYNFIMIGSVGKSVSVGAKAIDQYGVASALSEVQVKLVAPPPVADTTAPQVTISTPSNGSAVSANSTVSITASASDNVGVKSVEIRVNNTLLCTRSQSPYTCSWSIPKGGGKSYVINATATDAAGNSSSATSTVYTLRGGRGR